MSLQYLPILCSKIPGIAALPGHPGVRACDLPLQLPHHQRPRHGRQLQPLTGQHHRSGNTIHWWCGGSLLAMWWLIVGDVVAHCVMRWLIVGDVVVHCWWWGGSLLVMRWLIVGDVVAHCWRWGGSLLAMRWLIVGDVVGHCGWSGGSLLVMWWLS